MEWEMFHVKHCDVGIFKYKMKYSINQLVQRKVFHVKHWRGLRYNAISNLPAIV